jgi:hypothetical protein
LTIFLLYSNIIHIMKRRTFLKTSGLAAAASPVIIQSCSSANKTGETPAKAERIFQGAYPLAITMWEFSWLERHWSGAGYEDWDIALSELVERGYDAVRIDAFPHLIWNDPDQEYLLKPWWTTQVWGSPGVNRVKVQPNLNNFIRKCSEYGVKVGLSSWFRRDENDLQMKIKTPEDLGNAWLSVLRSIGLDGLLDNVFYVDLCNEWTGPAWCPYFENDPKDATWTGWHTEKSQEWMTKSIEILKKDYPGMPYTFSFTGEVTQGSIDKGGTGMLDFLEPHIWMVSGNGGEFYNKTGYHYAKFDFKDYENLALHGEKLYREKPGYWQKLLTTQIKKAKEWSEATGFPLVTTECWGVVDYRDWPLLNWDWVKELCVIGVKEAANTGKWLAISTSNFCGPQFVGMWRDIDWHRQLTGIIHKAKLSDDLHQSKLAKRMSNIQ